MYNLLTSRAVNVEACLSKTVYTEFKDTFSECSLTHFIYDGNPLGGCPGTEY